jgi:hypothetical protein
MIKNYFLHLLICILCITSSTTIAQHSVARDWNEQLLGAIRSDFARPTVHARNLFHTSVIMYDSWALFDDNAETVFLGKTFGNYDCPFTEIQLPETSEQKELARAEMMSYAVFRLLNHRFANSPGSSNSLNAFNVQFTGDGYNPNFISTDYSTNSFAALGNYLAEQMINFGLQDYSNEVNSYQNLYYTPENQPLILDIYEDQNDLVNPNAWQPLAFDVFVDQSGNPFPLNTPQFLSPEWGQVTPYSLKGQDLEVINNNFDCYVYKNPGPPEYIQNSVSNGISDPYKWHFALVAAWSSHLDPNDATLIDISPASLGNYDLNNFPETFTEYQNFYDFFNGGDASTGHNLNPVTGNPYQPQLIKRSDYARVLAEFWADGPDSETPPGHWFTLLNYVSDHNLTVKKIEGQGDVVSNLERDVKAYLTLGGAMHDAAIATWGLKGYYDYIRPISAIRYMAGKGQSTDPNLPSFDPHGLPLISGHIELINAGDPLAGNNNENVGKIKIFAWKGPDFIQNPDTDVAGVDWILGTHWWSYQRGTFVTPPFAGYLSGHSTFSRAAAEVLTLFTGDAFFPGGMGTFDVQQNDFLVFEEGPSESFTLQWATYRDASDQTSLSRIWGGIHPPIDDIRGRQIGAEIGTEAFELSKSYFNKPESVEDEETKVASLKIYPVPFNNFLTIELDFEIPTEVSFFNMRGELVMTKTINSGEKINTQQIASGIYFLSFLDLNTQETIVKKVVKL